MCAFFYSSFIIRNGRNAFPSVLLPGAEWTQCREWKSKMADGEISAADSNAPLPDLPEKKIRTHFWTQWNIASYFFVTKVRGVFQWFLLQEKRNVANYNRGNEKKEMATLHRQQNAGTGRSALLLRSGSAKTTTTTRVAAKFVTQCLLLPGPRISTGVFSCMQSKLFRAFCTNHSYSRIVNKLVISVWSECWREVEKLMRTIENWTAAENSFNLRGWGFRGYAE